MNENFSHYNGNGTILRKAQLRVLDILVEVDKIFRKNDISYWLMGGTLLGAVRHKGFIPWDDDIDISILHKDLQRATALLEKELPDIFKVQNYKNDRNYYLDSVTKIRDTKSLAYNEFHRSFKYQGLLLDIISVEKMPFPKLKKFLFKINKYPYLYRKNKSLNIEDGIFAKTKGVVLTPFAKVLLRFARLTSSLSSTKRYEHNYTFWLGNWFYYHFDESILFPLKEIEFEGRLFFAPNNVDAYLKEVYGDYMKIPDQENRTVHYAHIDVY